MEINGKGLVYGIVIALLLLLVLAAFGIINFTGNSTGNSATSGGSYSGIPEKCRPPTGESLEAWKEHLSHHAETQPCLKYFN